MTTILIADDHPVVRLGLKSLLERETTFTIVGEAFDGLETVRLVRKLNPDVLILDLMMPGMNGINVLSDVKLHAPATKVIILSMHASEPYVQEAFQRGSDGYVLKDTLAEEIVRAVHCVMSGRRYLGDLIEENEVTRAAADQADPYDTLTAREREILYYVAQGRKNREVAEHLKISIRTAETHRANLMRKLGLRNHAALVQYAFQKNIIPAVAAARACSSPQAEK